MYACHMSVALRGQTVLFLGTNTKEKIAVWPHKSYVSSARGLGTRLNESNKHVEFKVILSSSTHIHTHTCTHAHMHTHTNNKHIYTPDSSHDHFVLYHCPLHLSSHPRGLIHLKLMLQHLDQVPEI